MSPLLPMVRSEEVLGKGSGGGRVVLAGEEEMGKQGGKGDTDAASKQSMPKEHHQRPPVLPSASLDPLSPAKKKEKKEIRSEVSSKTAPTQALSLKPIQRPRNPSETPYIAGKTAAAETQPTVAPRLDPAKPRPPQPTRCPPALSGSPLISGEPTTKGKRPALASQKAPTNPTRSPIEPAFEELYDQWEAARRAPQIDLTIGEDPEVKREWFVELQAELRGAGLRAKLGG